MVLLPERGSFPKASAIGTFMACHTRLTSADIWPSLCAQKLIGRFLYKGRIGKRPINETQ